MTMGATKRFAATGGYTLLELLVTIAIFTVVALAGLPHVDGRRESINSSIQRVVADMRYARSRSITSGDHFAIEWTGSNSYEVQRMTLNGSGDWEVSDVVRTTQLPDHIAFVLTESIDRFEFNTRGMMVSSQGPLWPVISDTHVGSNHLLSIWPSGQIYREGLVS